MAFTASDWGQGRLLTGLTPSSSLSGFTALITKDNLPASALDTGSLSCLNGGGDFYVSEDVNGATQYPIDIVSCVTNATASSTEFVAHVRFPTYSSGTRSVYLFWNKAGQSQPLPGAAFGRNAVWTDYLAVQHLNEAVNTTAGGYVDSTGNGYDGTGVSMALPSVTANFGTAQDFDGSGDLIQIPELLTDAMGTNNTFVMSAWVNLDNTSGNQAVIGASRSFRRSYFLEAQNSDYIAMVGTGNSTDETAASGGATANQWQLLHSVWDGSTLSLYVDGSLLDSVTSSTVLRTTNSRPTAIGSVSGQSGDEGDFLDGQVHSVRFLNSVTGWGPDRVASEESNQSAPATFWAGGAVFIPGGGGTITVTEATQTIDWLTQTPSISFTGVISIEESTQPISFDSQDPVIDFTGTIIIEESTQVINWATENPLVTLTPPNTIIVTESTQIIDWATQDPIILFSGTITITESTQTINMLTQNPTIGFGTLWSDKPAASTAWTDSIISSTIWTNK